MPVTELSYATVSERFIEVVPELRRRYQRMLDEWEGEAPEQTIVFDDIVSRYLMGLLRFSEGKDDRLKAIFSILEKMAVHGDRHVRNLLAVTVCEHILGPKDIYDKAWSLMGPATRRIAHATAVSMGYTDR